MVAVRLQSLWRVRVLLAGDTIDSSSYELKSMLLLGTPSIICLLEGWALWPVATF